MIIFKDFETALYEPWEIAFIFGLTEMTFRKWLRKRKIREIKIGKKVYITKKALKTFLKDSNLPYA